MAEIRHYINGKDFGEPRNWQDLQITIDWLEQKESGAINVSDLEFVLEANRYLQERILDGLSGGVGVFEGEPYRIAVGPQQNPEFEFDGYLDFTEDMTVIGGEEIVCSLKRKKGSDWLADVADGFSFAYLYDQGVVNDGDFVKVPYVINYIPDGMQIVLLSLSIYMMTKELIENVEKLAETAADVIDAATPVIGVGAGLGAVAVTAWDLGNFILVTLKALARLAYIIAMTVAIIKLIEELFAQIIQKKRYHLGMTFTRMMERACQHLGLTLQSNLLQNSEVKNWVHIPRKDKKGGDRGEKGFPSNTEPIYTFGDLIRRLKEMFNADYRIKNGIFHFERRDAFHFPSNYKMPEFFNDQERLLDRFKLNTDEVISNYNIYWALDVQDQNTLDLQEGRVFQAVTSPVRTNHKEYVSIKNLAEIALPFSLGREKTELTTVEKIAKELGGIVDSMTGIFGRGTNFKNEIEARIGALLLSSHFLTSGKVVKMAGARLANNQRKELDARKLWEDYHFINSFAEYKGRHNQYYRFAEQRVPMTIEQFSALLENNVATDDKGQEYEIEKLVYNPYSGTGIIDFRVRKKYTNNLKLTFL